MNSTELIPAQLLKRKAIVYVRQSTQSQVMTNLESQRRQYDLVDIARQRGFADSMGTVAFRRDTATQSGDRAHLSIRANPESP